MCQALHRILRIAGFTPRIYRSAQACLDTDCTAEAICMILDVHLPDMDGFVLHERLAARESIPPVIFMTAYDEPEARAKAANAGAAALLIKPVPGRVLLETIGRAIGEP